MNIAVNTMHTGSRGYKNRGYAEQMTSEQLDGLLSEAWLRQMVAGIRGGNEALKDHLPYICPHYSAFRNNHRAQADIIPEAFTYMTCVDVDDKELVAKAIEQALAVNSDPFSDWEGQVLRIEYSARKKVHIYIRIPKGLTIEEAQRAFCQEIGVPYDESCITPERFIYLTGKDEEVYRSDKWLQDLTDEELAERREAYLERGLDVDGRVAHSQPAHSRPLPKGEEKGEEKGEAKEAVNESRGNDSPSLGEGMGVGQLLFKGIPYASIIREYWRRTGGEPAEGERNVKLHKLAVNLRAICDNKRELLMQIMPRFGLTDAELKSVVDSACKEPPKGISKVMQGIIDAMENGQWTIENEVDDVVEEKQFSTLNSQFSINKLPIGLKESLVGVPASMHMPVLCGIMPICGAYADQVEVEYCDGNKHHLGLMTIIRGEQASNKSVVKNAIDVWKRQFDEEDALARKREEAWKDRKKGRKANEKAPEDPHVLIRQVPVTVSCSTLLKRFKNAQGHTLYSFGEELDTLRKTNGAGSWSSKYDIYRLSFDRGEWGQDYNSDQAESGVVNVAYNWTMLGTNGALRKCFKADNIENGLSSRVLLAEMPDSSFQKMPKFGKRSAEDEARIQEAVTRLRSFTGLLDVPRLRKAIEQWVEEKRVEAAKDIDLVKDVYRKRAAVIGFRCGVIYHLLEVAPHTAPEGASIPNVSRNCIKFALLMAQYCLDQQMKAFGETLRNEYVNAQDECQRYGANHSIFDQLAPAFSRDDLRALKHDCSDSGLRNIIMRWKRDGWIEPVDRQHFRKTSQCPNVPSSH